MIECPFQTLRKWTNIIRMEIGDYVHVQRGTQDTENRTGDGSTDTVMNAESIEHLDDGFRGNDNLRLVHEECSRKYLPRRVANSSP